MLVDQRLTVICEAFPPLPHPATPREIKPRSLSPSSPLRLVFDSAPSRKDRYLRSEGYLSYYCSSELSHILLGRYEAKDFRGEQGATPQDEQHATRATCDESSVRRNEASNSRREQPATYKEARQLAMNELLISSNLRRISENI